MTHDPIIEEIRKIRHEIEVECRNDGDRYFQRILEIQKKYKNLIRRQPRHRLQVKEQKHEEMSTPQ